LPSIFPVGQAPEGRVDDLAHRGRDGGRHDDDDDRDEDLGQVGDDAGQQLADRVVTEDAERQREHEQEQAVEHDLGKDVARVVLALRQGLAQAATLDGAVEPDALEHLVDDLRNDLGEEVPDDENRKEAEKLWQELGCRRECIANWLVVHFAS
jgi:hypothetical protein